MVFRMRSWMWLLLVFFGMLGMLVPYGFLEMFFDRASTLWAAGVISVVGSAAMCGLYAVACRLVEKRQVSELGLRRLLPDMPLPTESRRSLLSSEVADRTSP